jgi:ABC-2 type transport system permease protein
VSRHKNIESLYNRDLLSMWRNPVLVKELRGRMRGQRAFILLTVYLSFLALLVLLVYLFYAATESSMLITNQRQVFSKTLYWIVYGVQMIAIAFIAPALTGGSISGERERQTYDLLRTSLLPARKLVLGKYLTGVVFLFLLIFSALPIQSLAFLLGGIAAQEVFLGTSILVVTTIMVCSVGILLSSYTSRSLLSIVVSYGFTLFNLFGMPIFLLIIFGMLQSSSISYIQNLSASGQAVLLSVGLIFIAINPVAATIVSEVFFVQGNSLLTFSVPLSNNTTIRLISPWIPYSLVFLLISLLLLWISIRKVRQPET